MKVSIYDMDGTIVDSSHRYRTIIDSSGIERIDLKYWRANEHRAMNDGLLPLAKQYLQDLKNPKVYTVIATARIMRKPDWQFVESILGMPDYFIWRREGENISGADLKIRGLQKFFNLKQFQSAAKQHNITFYEDNMQYLKKVCDKFNIRGVYIPSKQGH